MCWSAEADAAAGLVIGAIGADALRHVRSRSQVPLAALPVVLAAHQLVEVFVWWGLDGMVAASVGRAAVYAYLLIAFAVPVLVPVAVAVVEPDPRRRLLIERLGFAGAVVAVVLLASVALGPVRATDGGYHVAYQADLVYGGTLTAIYVVATLGCLLASSHRFVVAFGMVNLMAVVGLVWLSQKGFISLWCGWAALTSVIISVHLRRAGPEGVTPVESAAPGEAG